MERDDTPGSVRMLDAALTEFEKDTKSLDKLVLREEKLGFIELDSDDRPGPLKMLGYTVDMYFPIVE